LLQSYKKISPFFIPYAITNMGSALVAIDLGFMGPNYSISTACATANYAFHSACQHIRAGDADVMIAGGSEAPIIPVGLGGFVACRCVKAQLFGLLYFNVWFDKHSSLPVFSPLAVLE
jgi:3-oxoacyl-[acyl-carrier-protein] synthase II